MTRAILTIDTDDKLWLERRARQKNESMSELIRCAIKEMRQREEANFQGLLNKTSGLWKGVDGLEFQREIRGEWER